MSLVDRVIVVVMLVLLLASAGYVVWTLVRTFQLPDNPMNRFTYGWLGAFGLTVALSNSLGLSVILAQIEPTVLTIASAVIVNLLIQPIAILCSWMGLTKIRWAFLGEIYYAGTRVTGESPRWVWYNALRGLAFFVFGVVLGLGSAWPIVRWLSQ